MIFHSDKKNVLYPKLCINNSEIERVDSFNFLGLQLNHNLNWTKHINYISLKMSKIIGIIYKLKSVFPTAILRSIYNTLLLSHMSYCILSWGSQIDKIRLLQEKAIRNVNKVHTQLTWNLCTRNILTLTLKRVYFDNNDYCNLRKKKQFLKYI